MMRYRKQEDQEEHERLSDLTGIRFVSQDMTVQSEKENCDLNVLVRRFGILPVMRPVDPARFGVHDADIDLQRALGVVSDAERAFAELPARVRAAFDNDPMELLTAIQSAATDEAVRLELEELGIFSKTEQSIARVDPPSPPVTE